jgi:hypothetical protein
MKQIPVRNGTGAPRSFRAFCIPNRMFFCFSTPQQNRHPERSASQIDHVTQRSWRGVEGPRRCLLADALQSFPTTKLQAKLKKSQALSVRSRTRQAKPSNAFTLSSTGSRQGTGKSNRNVSFSAQVRQGEGHPSSSLWDPLGLNARVCGFSSDSHACPDNSGPRHSTSGRDHPSQRPAESAWEGSWPNSAAGWDATLQ